MIKTYSNNNVRYKTYPPSLHRIPLHSQSQNPSSQLDCFSPTMVNPDPAFPRSIANLEASVKSRISHLQCQHIGRLELNVCVLDEIQDASNARMEYSLQDVCQIMSREIDDWTSKKGICGVGRYVPKRFTWIPGSWWNQATLTPL